MERQLGKYRLGNQIARGGMGVVFQAIDTRLGRMAAVKVLSSDLSSDAGFVTRFRHEAITAANLKHNNIVTVYDMDMDQGQYYIAMEYVAGPDMRSLLKREGPLAPGRVAVILTQIAAALDYAHGQGVLHRDIKPSNILIEGEGEHEHVKLADFGIAKALNVTTSYTATRTRLGSPHYMSPEHAESLPVDVRSDVYSLGIVVYEMLTGAAPFQGDTTSAILYAHVKKRPPPFRMHLSGIPSRIEKVVQKALAKRPQDRYQSAGEFADAYRQALAASDSAAGKGGPSPLLRIGVPVVAAMLLVVLLILGLLRGCTVARPPLTVTQTAQQSSYTPIIRSPTPVQSDEILAPAAIPQMPTAPRAAGISTPETAPTLPRSLPPTRPLVPTRTPAPTLPRLTAPVLPTVTMPSELNLPMLLAPASGETRGGEVVFRWLPSGPLPSGAAYEVVWWQEGEPPDAARGIAEPTTNTSLRVNLNMLGGQGLRSPNVLWTVLIVRQAPYGRLTRPAGGEMRSLKVECPIRCDTCTRTVTDPVTGEVKTESYPCNCRSECG